MLIDTLNADCDGAVSQSAVDFISTQQMSHFIFRNSVTGTPVCDRRRAETDNP